MTPKLAAEIQSEQNHGRQKYGGSYDNFEHDASHTVQDWHDYIADHNERALIAWATPLERRQHLVKVAGLAASAIEAFDGKHDLELRAECGKAVTALLKRKKARK
jgi:hypothetical protein